MGDRHRRHETWAGLEQNRFWGLTALPSLPRPSRPFVDIVKALRANGVRPAGVMAARASGRFLLCLAEAILKGRPDFPFASDCANARRKESAAHAADRQQMNSLEAAMREVTR
jgi:hypothetical protein